MSRILPIFLLTLPILRAESLEKDDCRRPAYLPQLPQRLQGEVLEIWTDPEPETTLTYADEPVIFKPCCEWRMSRTKLLLSKLSRAEYYNIFLRHGPSPPRTTARVAPARARPAPPAPLRERPGTPPPPAPRYSTLGRSQAQPRVRAGAPSAPCRQPATVARLPPAVRARIRAIWRRRSPGMSCGEMHRKTKQIMINMPLRFRAALGRSRQRTIYSTTTPKPSMKTTTKPAAKPAPRVTAAPQLDCKLPHFLSRLEPALQEKLRRVWTGFKQGEDCAERVKQQLAILKAHDISVESFRMPFPSLYDDDLTPMRRRSSRRA
ncbi:hypothetical protein PRIPAC_81737 [Pristionchus pacificus]|uniref:Uncharacterized protein n=1 Tax=Pristionchus pacificus TaxID=54126 RepID=A0A2A6BXB3_PRIPA|nr:hypothetical protein PRIPAC_81737 [Pristionchus pacificus]|eukprot:PDM70518.1 hypothetical protein PRIPAC_46764 [Pristionchus pacificus]